MLRGLFLNFVPMTARSSFTKVIKVSFSLDQRWAEKPIRWVKEKSKACRWSWGEKGKTRIYHIRYNGKKGSLVCTRDSFVPRLHQYRKFLHRKSWWGICINSFKNRNYSHSKKLIFLNKVIFFSRFSKVTSLHREEKYRKFYRKKDSWRLTLYQSRPLFVWDLTSYNLPRWFQNPKKQESIILASCHQ